MEIFGNVTKIDTINMKLGAEGYSQLKNNGITYTVVGGAYEKREENGETVFVSFLKTEDGKVIGGRSQTAYKTCELISELFSDNTVDFLNVVIESGKSNAGREFVKLRIV